MIEYRLNHAEYTELKNSVPPELKEAILRVCDHSKACDKDIELIRNHFKNKSE